MEQGGKEKGWAEEQRGALLEGRVSDVDAPGLATAVKQMQATLREEVEELARGAVEAMQEEAVVAAGEQQSYWQSLLESQLELNPSLWHACDDFLCKESKRQSNSREVIRLCWLVSEDRVRDAKELPGEDLNLKYTSLQSALAAMSRARSEDEKARIMREQLDANFLAEDLADSESESESSSDASGAEDQPAYSCDLPAAVELTASLS